MLELAGDAKPQIPATKEFDVSAAHFSYCVCDNTDHQIVSSEIGAIAQAVQNDTMYCESY